MRNYPHPQIEKKKVLLSYIIRKNNLANLVLIFQKRNQVRVVKKKETPRTTS